MERVTNLTYRGFNYLIDFVLLSIAFGIGVCAWWFRYFGTIDFAELWNNIEFSLLVVPYLIFYGTNFFYLSYTRAYHLSRLQPLSASAAVYIRSLSCSLVVLALATYFLPFIAVGRTLLVVSSILGAFFLIMKERTLRNVLRRLRRGGYYVRRTIIVGSDREFIEELLEESENDYFLGK